MFIKTLLPHSLAFFIDMELVLYNCEMFVWCVLSDNIGSVGGNQVVTSAHCSHSSAHTSLR